MPQSPQPQQIIDINGLIISVLGDFDTLEEKQIDQYCIVLSNCHDYQASNALSGKLSDNLRAELDELSLYIKGYIEKQANLSKEDVAYYIKHFYIPKFTADLTLVAMKKKLLAPHKALAQQEKEITTLKSKLDKATHQIAEAKKDYQKTDEERQHLQSQNSSLEQRVENITLEANEANKLLKKTRRKLDAKNKALKKTKDELAKAKQQIDSQKKESETLSQTLSATEDELHNTLIKFREQQRSTLSEMGKLKSAVKKQEQQSSITTKENTRLQNENKKLRTALKNALGKKSKTQNKKEEKLRFKGNISVITDRVLKDRNKAALQAMGVSLFAQQRLQNAKLSDELPLLSIDSITTDNVEITLDGLGYNSKPTNKLNIWVHILEEGSFYHGTYRTSYHGLNKYFQIRELENGDDLLEILKQYRDNTLDETQIKALAEQLKEEILEHLQQLEKTAKSTKLADNDINALLQKTAKLKHLISINSNRSEVVYLCNTVLYYICANNIDMIGPLLDCNNVSRIKKIMDVARSISKDEQQHIKDNIQQFLEKDKTPVIRFPKESLSPELELADNKEHKPAENNSEQQSNGTSFLSSDAELLEELYSETTDWEVDSDTQPKDKNETKPSHHQSSLTSFFASKGSTHEEKEGKQTDAQDRDDIPYVHLFSPPSLDPALTVPLIIDYNAAEMPPAVNDLKDLSVAEVESLFDQPKQQATNATTEEPADDNDITSSFLII